MANDTSCITYPSQDTMVIVRKSLVGICKDAPDPLCAAALLNNFIYWHDGRLRNRPQANKRNDVAEEGGEPRSQDESLWVWESNEDLKESLMDIWGERKVFDNRTWLVKVGYVEQRNNPNHNWDRTLQYQLSVDKIQSALGAGIDSLHSAKLQDQDCKNAGAIPKKSTKKKNKKILATPSGIASASGSDDSGDEIAADDTDPGDAVQGEKPALKTKTSRYAGLPSGIVNGQRKKVDVEGDDGESNRLLPETALEQFLIDNTGGYSKKYLTARQRRLLNTPLEVPRSGEDKLVSMPPLNQFYDENEHYRRYVKWYICEKRNPVIKNGTGRATEAATESVLKTLLQPNREENGWFAWSSKHKNIPPVMPEVTSHDDSIPDPWDIQFETKGR